MKAAAGLEGQGDPPTAKGWFRRVEAKRRRDYIAEGSLASGEPSFALTWREPGRKRRGFSDPDIGETATRTLTRLGTAESREARGFLHYWCRVYSLDRAAQAVFGLLEVRREA